LLSQLVGKLLNKHRRLDTEPQPTRNISILPEHRWDPFTSLDLP